MNRTIYSTGELGRAIRAERKALGLTQGDLAAASGISTRFLSEVERGRASAGIGRILRVLKMLGLHVTLVSPREAGSPSLRPPTTSSVPPSIAATPSVWP